MIKDEVRVALKGNKDGKAVGPDDKQSRGMEVSREEGSGVFFLTKLFNAILDSEMMSEE